MAATDRLKQFKPHEQEWGIREYNNGENINNITDSITIYNNNIRDNRFSSILARHNPNYRNILNFTSKIIHAALIEYEELKAPKPSNRQLQEARRKWSIQEPPHSRILVDNDRVRVIRVTRVDDTGKAAKIASDMSHKSEWCTVNTEMADMYLKRDDLYFILLASNSAKTHGGKYLYHAELEQLMDFENEPFRLSEYQYYLLSEYVPGIGLFIKDKRSEIYKNTVIKYPRTAYWYARDVLGRRWPEAEPIIMRDTKIAYWYAIDLGIKRWPEAEPVMMSDSWTAYRYACRILRREWPEAEPIIIGSAQDACDYARHVMKREWPEAEPVIMSDPKIAFEYTRYVLRRRWPEAEPVIMRDPEIAYCYARFILGRRWPEAEPNILNSSYAYDYRDRFEMLNHHKR